MNKKLIGILVCLLFFGVSVVSGINNQIKETEKSSRGITLYVGGSGANNYTKIQDAIDNTSDGDTVYVYNGVYNENLIIDVSIQLIGENKNLTILDGENLIDWGIEVWTSNNILLSNFTIQNFSGGISKGGAGPGIDQIISNNFYSCSFEAIHVYKGDNCIVEDNYISNCAIGIMLVQVDYSLINKNFIINTQIAGIYSFNPSPGVYAMGNIFSNNTIVNSEYCELGIELLLPANNLIENNIIKNTNMSLNLYSGKNNIIKNNNITYNILGLNFDENSDSHVYHNNFIGNYQNAIDNGINTWDNGYPSGGNYWDNYNGTDSNYDGIGDTPYPIPGGDSEDRYPFMNPNGWANQPPDAPTISGPNRGKPNDEYIYTFRAVDSDGDDVRFHIDWSDGDSDITSFTSSGSNVVVSHIWAGQGTYNITVYAKDEFGAVSGETTSQMIIDKSKSINTPFLNFLQSHPNMFPILQLQIQRLGLQ